MARRRSDRVDAGRDFRAAVECRGPWPRLGDRCGPRRCRHRRQRNRRERAAGLCGWLSQLPLGRAVRPLGQLPRQHQGVPLLLLIAPKPAIGAYAPPFPRADLLDPPGPPPGGSPFLRLESSTHGACDDHHTNAVCAEPVETFLSGHATNDQQSHSGPQDKRETSMNTKTIGPLDEARSSSRSRVVVAGALLALLVAGAAGLYFFFMSSPSSSLYTTASSPVVASSKPGQGSATDRRPDCRERLFALGVYLTEDQPCFDLDDVVKNLRTGTYRYNKPEAAYVDEPFRVVLVLPTAPGQNVSGPFIGAPGNVQEREAPIARYLQATLRGGIDFRVIPPDPQPRTVTTSSPVVWEWTVVPLRHGKKSLVIDVSANLLVGPQKELVQLQTLSEEIQINVGIVRWITSTFFGLPGIALGLAAMIVVGLGALNYLRPGSVARGAAVLVAGDTMPAGGARSKLRAAILAGFDHDSLDQFLGDNNMLSPDIGTGSLRKRVDSLIEVARQQGWLIELCDALATARSRNVPVSSAILAVRQSLMDQLTRATQPAVTSG